MKRALSLFFIFILILSMVSFSAIASQGNSSDDDSEDDSEDSYDDSYKNGSNDDSDDASDEDEVEVEIEIENETEGYKYKEKLRIKCESESDREERIRCKIRSEIREHKEDVKSVPEACRNLKDSITNSTNFSEIRFTKERCKKLFEEIRPCHEKEGKDKLVCFKRVSGLGTAAVSGEANKTNLINYVVSLLDDLQVRIENAATNDKITDEKAVEIIALIVEAKEKILNESSKEEVKPILEELRIKIQEVKAEVNSNE